MSVTFLELYRRKVGLTIKELAEKADYVPNAISQVEHGHRRPWPELRSRLAKALGVRESVLFDESGWPLRVDIETLLRAAGE